jgi:hypothetical protein
MRARHVGTLCAVLLLAGSACGDDTDDGAPTTDLAPADGGDPPEPEPGEPDDGDEPDVPEHLGAVGSDEWVELADAPVALTEVDAAAHDGELWVVGGFDEGAGVVTLAQVYDPATDTWRDGPELPEPVHHAALVSTGEVLVLIGGYRTVAFEPIADVLVLDVEAEEWTPGPDLPEARGAGAAAFDGERVVFGGGVGPDGLADDVWALEPPDADDPAGGGWVPVGSLSVPRDHLDAASDGTGTVWFLAGRELGLDRNLGTVDLVRGDEVTALGELPTPRGGVGAFHVDAHGACLTGGEAPESTFDEVECIDADGEITTLPALNRSRHGHGADVIDGVVLVALGGPEPLLSVSASLEALRP